MFHGRHLARIKIWPLFAATLFAFLLSSCSDETTVTKEGDCVDTGEGGVLCLKLIDSAGALTRNMNRNSTASLVATIKSPDNAGIEGVVVTFGTDVGQLANDGKGLTNANGEASIVITSGITPATAVATAAFDDAGTELSVSSGFIIGGTIDNPTTEEPVEEQPTEEEPVVVPDPSVSTSITGAIEFVSATPSTIALRNTGGTGLTEFSTVQFRIIGTDGRPMTNRVVNFSLNTNIGGIDLDPTTFTTGSDGLATTTLQAGSIPTSIRVTATSQMTDINDTVQTIFTQSDQLVVSTGIPDQNSMSIAVSELNPEAWNLNGTEVTVTARLADHFNNMVPDGTAVYFTAEGGAIQPSCFTENGTCNVTWRSQSPKPADHRVTILATAIGNETFHDTNSDGRYSLADGEPFADTNGNGLYDEPFQDDNTNGIFDEPFLVQNNGIYDLGESFVDALNGYYDIAFTHVSGVLIPAEVFVDEGNGQWDLGEIITNDVNSNGIADPGDTYVDAGNGEWDPGEAFTDSTNGVYDPGESFTDTLNSIYDLGDVFIDYNGNGIYNGEGNNPVGELNFTDSFAGNSLYDGQGNIPLGETYTDAKTTGDSSGKFDGPGFPDLAEPFLDNNENSKYDIGEPYVDTNNNGIIDLTGDGKYNGVLCIKDNNCSDTNTLHIRQSIVLIMSSSDAYITLTDANFGQVYGSNDSRISRNRFLNVSSQPVSLRLQVTDSAAQVMPAGTVISVVAPDAKLLGSTTFTVPSTRGGAYQQRGPDSSENTQELGHYLYFTLLDADITEEEESVLTIIVRTPSGVETNFSLNFRT